MSDYLVLNGRVATEAEAEAKRVIFFVPDGQSEPFRFSQALPLAARTVLEGERDGFPPPGTAVEIIQAGISEVVSHPFKVGPSKWRDDVEMAQALLQEAGVAYREVSLR